MSTHVDEKSKAAHVRQTGSSSSSDNDPPAGFLPAAAGVTNVDAAWKFLNEHRDAEGIDAVNLTALRHKIDWHIVPLMFLCYTMQFLDKVILNVSHDLFATFLSEATSASLWPVPGSGCSVAVGNYPRLLNR